MFIMRSKEGGWICVNIVIMKYVIDVAKKWNTKAKQQRYLKDLLEQVNLSFYLYSMETQLVMIIQNNMLSYVATVQEN